jgi:Family of unknown function (DUF6356)
MTSFDDETINHIADSVIRIKERCNLVDKLYELFIRHPKKNGMSYGSHWWRAMKLSLKMGYGSLCLFIHSLCPFVFETTGTDMVKELYNYVITHKENKEENKKSE